MIEIKVGARIKDELEDANPLDEKITEQEWMLYADMLRLSFEEIEWEKLASGLIDDIRHS
jgi:hypothetical protein